MIKRNVILSLLLLATVSLFSQTWMYSQKQAIETGNKNGKPYLYFFYATVNAQSTQFYNEFNNSKDYADYLPQFNLVKINVQTQEDLPGQMGVYQIPAIVLQSNDLKDKNVVIKPKDKDFLINNIRLFLGKHITIPEKKAVPRTPYKYNRSTSSSSNSATYSNYSNRSQQRQPAKSDNIVEIKITGTGSKGDGKGKYKGKTIYVRGTTKDDVGTMVDTKILKASDKYYLGVAVLADAELSVGNQLSVTIKEKSRKGNDGVCYIKGKITFVRNAEIGAKYLIEITKVAPTYNVAKSVRKLK